MSAYLHHATSPSTIHILSYGILAGTTVFQTFLNGPIAYKTLPRQQFGNLQSQLFPPFFTLQAVTGAVCFLTSYYYSRTATYNELLAMGGVTLSGLLNLILIGPWVTGIMNARHRLERATNTKYTDSVVSDEMRSLTTRFNIAHSVSSIVNLAAVGAVVAHAIHLGHKLSAAQAF